MTNPTDDEIREILRSATVIAVVGLSTNPGRPSFGVARYLQAAGYKIVPVNPKHAGQTILGEPVVTNLHEIGEPVDIVDVFRRSVDVPRPAREAIEIGARTLWLQLGIRNDEAAELARGSGLQVVQDRCISIEHRRLIDLPDPDS